MSKTPFKKRAKPSSRSASPSRAAQPERSAPSPSIVSDRGFGIVAVGASAGGLEAFSEVLSSVPSPSDLAFILVQHLSPQHASSLPELLANKTTLKVLTAANRMAIAPGHLYVMPPNVHM